MSGISEKRHEILQMKISARIPCLVEKQTVIVSGLEVFYTPKTLYHNSKDVFLQT